MALSPAQSSRTSSPMPTFTGRLTPSLWAATVSSPLLSDTPAAPRGTASQATARPAARSPSGRSKGCRRGSRCPGRRAGTRSSVPDITPMWMPSLVVPPCTSPTSLSSATRNRSHEPSGSMSARTAGVRDEAERGSVGGAGVVVLDVLARGLGRVLVAEALEERAAARPRGRGRRASRCRPAWPACSGRGRRPRRAGSGRAAGCCRTSPGRRPSRAPRAPRSPRTG